MPDFSFNLQNLGVFSLFTHGGPIGILVSCLLALLSLWAWITIFYKLRSLSSMYSKSEKFLQHFWEAKTLSELNTKSKEIPYSPAREVFRCGFNEMIRILQAREKKGNISTLVFDTVKRALSRQKHVEEYHLSNHMSILSICASAAPFIGLFGTVIGVIRAFHDIGSSGVNSLSAVAPGLSEALIATALGLFVAIPSVIFYNIISSQIKKHLVLLDGFASDFINILERHYALNKNEDN